ncbi:MAG: endonuclease domain-containing protein [Steroidobacter sp.]
MQGSIRANELRRNQTDAEKLLWYRLRDRRLNGYKFRRQLPIGPYVADFVCMSARLVVELDGGQHAEHANYDRERERYIRSERFEILRFWNNDVMSNLNGVLDVLLRALIERSRPSP